VLSTFFFLFFWEAAWNAALTRTACLSDQPDSYDVQFARKAPDMLHRPMTKIIQGSGGALLFAGFIVNLLFI
jgi:hypothetical protein